MKLAILSRNSKLYSTQRLVAAARERGHVVRVLDPLRCYMKIGPGRFQINYQGRTLSGVEAVIPRIGASVTRYGTAVLRQFELMGAYSPNSSDAILRARDKLRCQQMLAGEGIGLPTTVFGDNPDDTDDLSSAPTCNAAAKPAPWRSPMPSARPRCGRRGWSGWRSPAWT